MYHPLPLIEEQSQFAYCYNHRKNAKCLRLFSKYYLATIIQDLFHSVTCYLILAYFIDTRNELNLIKGLIPHFVAIVFTGAISIYIAASDGAKSALRMWRSGNQNSYKFIIIISCYWIWCLILGPLIFLICVIFMIMVFPWTTFQWTILYASSHYAGRLYDCTSIQHIDAILKYILNNKTSTEVKRRIISCNYYLMAMLSQAIETNVVKQEGVKCKEPRTLINFIANTHNDNIGVGVNIIEWRDLRVNNKVSGADDHGAGDLIFLVWFILLLIYDFVWLIILFFTKYNDMPIFLIIMGIICILMEMIAFLMEVKILRLLYYCYHLLPFIGNVNGLKINEKFNDVEIMMENIMIVYEIMFGGVIEIELVMDNTNVIHPDIGKIIAEYLWCPLPVYHNETIDLNVLHFCNKFVEE